MTVQHVIFWRHAEADDIVASAGSAKDLARELTRAGQRDAARVAAWIKTHCPKPRLVVSSPAARARQTALALSDDPLIDARLAPQAGVDDLLQALAEHGSQGTTLVLVGHQPTMGSAALRWAGGGEAPFALRKSGFVWVSSRARDDGNARIVRAVLSADLLD